MLIRIAAVLAFLLFAIASRAAARPGDLDATFGESGRAAVPVGIVGDVAIDGANRLVVLGVSSEPGSSPKFPHRYLVSVVRYDGAGTIDPTFGTDGLVEVEPRSYGVVTGRLAMQPDGKVVVAVTRRYPGLPGHVSTLELTRLTADGRLDPSFGDDGAVVESTREDQPGFATPDVFVSPNGLITVAASECRTYDDCGLTVLRYQTNGARLSRTHTASDAAGLTGARVALGRNGSLLLGGALGGPTGAILAFERYTPSGQIDRLYPDRGHMETDLPVFVPTFTVDADDRPIAVGVREDDLEVQRFGPSGKRDSFFTPTVITLSRTHQTPVAVALEPDRRVVVGATADFLNPNGFTFGSRWLVAVLDPNGGLDTSFGEDGLLVFGGPPPPPDATGDFVTALTLQADGRIVVAGVAGNETLLARFEGPTRECGDADGNGTLSVTDGVRVLRAGADLPSSCLASFCDTDADGSVGVTDGVRVLRAAADLPIDLRCAP